MTNPKTRKTGKQPSLHQQQPNAIAATASDDNEHQQQHADVTDEDEQCDIMSTWMQEQTAVSTVEADSSLTPTPSENNGADDTDSCSSFSLQECIDQFHARRVRRKSTQSRDAVENDYDGGGGGDAPVRIVPVDEELIKQNRTNREHERKCKPCENGFCYCFTSDSGDGGGGRGGGAGGGGCGDEARVAHVRHTRRQRKSESSQGVQTALQQPPAAFKETKEKPHFAAANKSPQKPPNMVKTVPNVIYSSPTKTYNSSQLTAISRLETASPDAPLVHIIQELHDNCVISEVRVNRHKIEAHQRSHSLSSKPSPKKTQFKLETAKSRHDNCRSNLASKVVSYNETMKHSTPSAPTLDKFSEIDSEEGVIEDCVHSSPLNSSSKSLDSQRARHKAGGRLLQKRLSGSRIQFKPRNLNEPPPKPPRSSFGCEDKLSVSTIASTTPSVRDAERVLDDFLRRRGIKVPVANDPMRLPRHSAPNKDSAAAAAARRDKRNSYAISQSEAHQIIDKPLPTCPSLSDVERVLDDKRSGNYEKNLRRVHEEKPIKEISFGWKEPRIEEMLNYEDSGASKAFVSQAVQAEPQYHIGWDVPHKIDLDTVDSGEGPNLASNIEKKSTPIKTRFLSDRKTKCSKRHSQKFIFAEQFRNLSPWTRKKGSAVNNVTHPPQPPLKSNLKTASRAFLNNSKRKILRLVSPKKDNSAPRVFCTHQTPKRTVGVQTTQTDGTPSYENSSTPQSPPGSYHSAVQTSLLSSSSQTQNVTHTPDNRFDFSRTVHSPPKKAARPSHRRLNFPMNCVEGSDCIDGDTSKSAATLTKTYRSYQADLDQDVNLSKMGYILSNIRAKLEASDKHAARTFQETANRNSGFDRPDSLELRSRHSPPRISTNRHVVEWENDPIYSEIEEESLHIAGSPQVDNKTGVDHFPVHQNPEILYAKVNKPQKTTSANASSLPSPPKPPPPPPTPSSSATPNTSMPTSLGKVLHDSLKQRQADNLPPFVADAPGRHSDVSYTSVVAPAMPVTTSSTSLIHCQSLNNVRVAQHNSPPKRIPNLSKSDLSLHRSEIFLENLCRSELQLISGEPLEKVENVAQGNVADISYSSVPNEDIGEHTDRSFELTNVSVYEYDDSNAAGSYLGLDTLESTHARNQSTPMKQQQYEQQNMSDASTSTAAATIAARPKKFITKPQNEENAIVLYQPPLSVAVSNDHLAHASTSTGVQLLNESYSCPTTPQCLPCLPPTNQPQKRSAVSLDAVFEYNKNNSITNRNSSHNNTAHNDVSTSAHNRSHYKKLKNVLRLSFRKSKKFFKVETKRLSTSLNFPATATTPPASDKDERHNQSYSPDSTFDLTALFSLNANPTDELVKAVSICRQLPNLEVSPEMVEAERLLLYSTLRRNAAKHKLQIFKCQPYLGSGESHNLRFFIDGMRLPIKPNVSQDLFFNYFYICTFECDGIIKSTQSVECCNGMAVFEDCGIEFTCSPKSPRSSQPVVDDLSIEVNCQVFMLRLRKVSTLSLEPHRRIVKLPALLTPSPTSSSSSASDEVVSRFKLHATFTLCASSFVPYEYVDVVSKNSDCICLRTSRTCQPIALTLQTKSTNLANELLLTGRAEARLPKQLQRGYLNVQNPYTLHNWNRRWCILEGFVLNVWTDENDIAELPILSLDLRTNEQALPLSTAPRELCGRPRSFCLQCVVKSRKSDVPAVEYKDEDASAAVFFTADSQDDLNTWLHELNEAFQCIQKWL